MNAPRPLAAVLALALVLPAILTAPPVLADGAPPLINYQGVLRDSQGNPLDGPHEMIFRYYTASFAGMEIMQEGHMGADAVEVSQGLFNVVLGSGLTIDGGTVLPGDPYLSLEDVFRDFDEVWMEIWVGGETLTPRLRVTSAAYALNASNLGGRPPASYIDTSAAPQTKAGALTVATIVLTGALMSINADGPDSDQYVAFHDGGVAASEFMKWDESNDRFEFSNALAVNGPLRTGTTAQVAEVFNHLGDAGDSPDSGDMNGTHDLYVEGDVEIESSLYLAGQAYMKDTGADADQNFWFFNDGSRTGEAFKWDEAGDRFEFSNSLAIAGPLRTGSTTDPDETFNHFGNFGDAPDSEDITGTQDIYVEGDLEVESTLYLAGEVIMRDFGGDASQFLFFYDGGVLDDEWFTWDDGADRFEISDSLHVYGELTALTKNFVQNHPARPDLEVVYTSLEGDESAVFTRGSGRLENGTARVALGGSFALVANPEVGLSAHLTARGGWADLYVESLTPEYLVVRARPGAADVAFDFVVFGLRAGWEEFPVLRPRRADAPAPAAGAFEAIYAAVPEARALSPLARHAGMAALASAGDAAGHGHDRPGTDADAARRLRDGIGARDGSEPARPPRPDRRLDDQTGTGAPAASSVTAGATLAAGSQVVSGTAASRPAAPAADPATAATRTAATATGATGGAAAPRHRDPVFVVNGPVEPGDLVSLDPNVPGTLRRAAFESDPGVVGIVVALDAAALPDAAGPIVEAAVAAPAGDPAERIGIAVGGVASVRVDTAYGSIRPGDLLAASATPGHAMRAGAHLPGTLVGKALEAADSGTPMIRVLLVSR